MTPDKPLSEVYVDLVGARDRLDALDELLAAHRHASDDDGERLELHAIGDAVNRAWGHVQVATTALRELLAVRS